MSSENETKSNEPDQDTKSLSCSNERQDNTELIERKISETKRTNLNHNNITVDTDLSSNTTTEATFTINAKSTDNPSISSSTSKSDKTEKLSKNQLRKRKKKEYIAEKKRRKKLQDKEVKRQKALAAGRDLDKERKEQEENAKLGEGRKRREEVRLYL